MNAQARLAAVLGHVPPELAQVEAPAAWRLALEARSVWEHMAAHLAAAPIAVRAPAGDGHPVLVIPGLGAGDASTALLRRYLVRLGYDAQGWALGRNSGFEPLREAQLARRIRALSRDHRGARVTLIGWSLGGIYAREQARRSAARIRQVITLGTPFCGHPFANNAVLVYEMLSGGRIGRGDVERFGKLARALEVPTTSVYSKSDGVVSWRCSVLDAGARAQNLEVRGASHLGLGYHPATLVILSDRLAQAADDWRPMAVPRGMGAFIGTGAPVTGRPAGSPGR